MDPARDAMWSYVAQVASLLSFASWHAASLCIFSTKDLILKLVVGTPKAENENETRNGEDEGEPPAVVFYEGHVVHSRAEPVKNAFKYEIRLALINLDKPPAWWQADSGKRQLALTPELVRRECNTKGTAKGRREKARLFVVGRSKSHHANTTRQD